MYERIAAVERPLIAYGVLAPEIRLARGPFKEEMNEILKLERGDHMLGVTAFADSTVLFAFVKTRDPGTAIILIAEKDKRYVSVLPNFPDASSEEMIDLWNKMPDRKDVDKGTFTSQNWFAAIDLFVRSFAALPKVDTTRQVIVPPPPKQPVVRRRVRTKTKARPH